MYKKSALVKFKFRCCSFKRGLIFQIFRTLSKFRQAQVTPAGLLVPFIFSLLASLKSICGLRSWRVSLLNTVNQKRQMATL